MTNEPKNDDSMGAAGASGSLWERATRAWQGVGGIGPMPMQGLRPDVMTKEIAERQPDALEYARACAHIQRHALRLRLIEAALSACIDVAHRVIDDTRVSPRAWAANEAAAQADAVLALLDAEAKGDAEAGAVDAAEHAEGTGRLCFDVFARAAGVSPRFEGLCAADRHGWRVLGGYVDRCVGRAADGTMPRVIAEAPTLAALAATAPGAPPTDPDLARLRADIEAAGGLSAYLRARHDVGPVAAEFAALGGVPAFLDEDGRIVHNAGERGRK